MCICIRAKKQICMSKFNKPKFFLKKPLTFIDIRDRINKSVEDSG